MNSWKLSRTKDKTKDLLSLRPSFIPTVPFHQRKEKRPKKSVEN